MASCLLYGFVIKLLFFELRLTANQASWVKLPESDECRLCVKWRDQPKLSVLKKNKNGSEFCHLKFIIFEKGLNCWLTSKSIHIQL
jgi:hypothetical protein